MDLKDLRPPDSIEVVTVSDDGTVPFAGGKKGHPDIALLGRKDQQPAIASQTRRKTNYKPGTHRAQARLEQLNFDPIEKLVRLAGFLEEEMDYQNRKRQGTVVEISASTGKKRAFKEEDLYNIYEKQITVAKELLRYKYGRVPETVNVNEKHIPVFNVNLTAKGETYTIDTDGVLGDLAEATDEEFPDEGNYGH